MKTMRILVLMAATAALNWPSLVAVECGGATGHAQSAAADGCGDQPLDKIGTSGGPENEAGSQVPIHTALASRSSFATERTGFEPADQGIPGHRFSKPALSTTQPPLRSRERTARF
jgi:hypothetical protein